MYNQYRYNKTINIYKYLSYTQKRSIIRKCFDHKPTFQHPAKTQNDES